MNIHRLPPIGWTGGGLYEKKGEKWRRALLLRGDTGYAHIGNADDAQLVLVAGRGGTAGSWLSGDVPGPVTYSHGQTHTLAIEKFGKERSNHGYGPEKGYI